VEEDNMPILPTHLSPVTAIPAAAPRDAQAHFEALLSFETDCWDVQAELGNAQRGFILMDVRSPESFAAGHLPEAVNLPYARINERNLDRYSPQTLFVVYCDGPHCNGADRAAARLARLGRYVKKMIGGVRGWTDEGYDLVR
jgi:rhodanese-related sulfurtransferase